ncbi:MAG: hypothetical protein GY810_00140 [Aureispira sp.]|nr:hypothetical protein [Aureispira sp.]
MIKNFLNRIDTRVIGILCIIFICSLTPVQTQAINKATASYKKEVLRERSSSNKDVWKAMSKDLKYAKKPKARKKEDIKKDTTINNANLGNINQNQPTEAREPMTFKDFARILLIILAVIVIAIVVFRAVGGNVILTNSDIRRPRKITLENIEENLEKADVESFLKEALKKTNYKLAIRLYFLAIMKELSRKGSINWQRDKTNGAYLMEMRRHPKSKQFAKITRMFEYVWYSKMAFDKETFEEIRPEFKSLLMAVK